MKASNLGIFFVEVDDRAEPVTLSGNAMPGSAVPLSPAETVTAGVIAVLGYVIVFTLPIAAPAILVALPALCLLSRQRTVWHALVVGLLVGLAISVSLLTFMYSIFGFFAAALWLVGALPYGVFVALLNMAHRRLGPIWAFCLTPVLWTGIEFFRSEVWALRFAWILPGQASALLPGVRLAAIGVYGLGFVYMLLAAMLVGPRKWLRNLGVIGSIIAAALMYVPASPLAPVGGPLHVAGLQTEYWDVAEIATALEKLAAAHPEAQLLVLNELAFDGPIPQEVRDVVRKNHRYLIAGGKTPIKEGGFYNTAFVVGPDGNDLFEQVKSVPVQFINDGQPATEHRVWESPWGKIGIAICYDACFARVMDDFVQQGARGLIIPTMDVQDWGEFERRELHGRVQPIRSAEYGIPTFGVWSSGISQLTDRYGRVVASAGYPGQGETLAGSFDLSHAGHVPPDRVLGWITLAGTVAFVGYLAIQSVRALVATKIPASDN
ncbi:MAG TPA: nitrilase-related carbon-nitrogen hydrolase [Lacipirellulaceae bacterium]|nr:nitrilase-related carbon-nitrogen hydrolase [Lacipirellulaceae bacterium]